VDVLSFFQQAQNALSYPFMQNALLASALASLACGIIGAYVIHNRLTFLAGGISHSAYGGIGIAMYFQLPVLPCVLVFSLAASMLMGALCLRRADSKKESPQETAIGVLWAAGMALGIILIELTPGYAGEIMGFLFGSLLAVPDGDLAAMAVFDGILLLALAFFYQGLWALSLDREFARARGLPVRALYLLLVGLTAVTVVMLIRVVGLILVLALLTIPSFLAMRICRTLLTSMLAAALLSFGFCLGGLVLAWHTDASSGASIIAVATLAYCLAQLPALREKKTRRRSASAIR
jgi:zinc transport system permease protein